MPLRRGGRARTSTARSDALTLAVLLASSGAAHFIVPKPYDSIIPRALPGSPRRWTQASGVAELAVAAALVVPRTRRIGGLAAAGLFVAVLPANVTMARAWRHKPWPMRVAAYARLPLQVPLIVRALRVARDTR